MELKENDIFPETKRGRPSLYPFQDLKPKTKLVIPGKPDLKKHRVSVCASLNIYKKNLGLNWTTIVVIEGNNIAAYRKD